MTRLQWDQSGSRQYENGCDRGVLYLPDGSAVPWNGLVSVSDDAGDINVEEYFLDGVKYLNRRSVGDYAGTLKAITYPDEFLQFDGIDSIDVGVYATGQPVHETFGLSYRTRIATDTNPDAGYKIHLLYNLTAKPDTKTYTSQASSASADEFSWTLSGIPIPVANMRPTVHLIINSTEIDAGHMSTIEDYIYGTDLQSPQLPDAATLLLFQSDLISDPIVEPL